MLQETWSFWIQSPVYIGVVGLAVAVFFYLRVLALPQGNETMNRIAGYIREGAMAYLTRQYITLGIYAAIVCVALGFSLGADAAKNCSGVHIFHGASNKNTNHTDGQPKS